MRNIKMDCEIFFNVGADPGNANVNSYKYVLSDFSFENLEIKAKNPAIDTSVIKNFKLKDVTVNGKKLF